MLRSTPALCATAAAHDILLWIEQVAAERPGMCVCVGRHDSIAEEQRGHKAQTTVPSVEVGQKVIANGV